MRKLRTIRCVRDDLQSFAEDWLNGPAHLWNAKSISHADGVLVSCLYQDEQFQVELCCASPGLVIPDHIHPHADTIELNVVGVLRLHVNREDIYAGLTDENAQRLSHWGVRINSTDIHGTVTPVGKNGAMFLSIQKWVGKPQSVLTDYIGSPLGNLHQEIINGRS